MARGMPLEEMLRMGAAAGSVNVVRRGLGSGSRADIERLAGEVILRPLDPPEIAGRGNAECLPPQQ
jgi:1-phosphofructokinase